MTVRADIERREGAAGLEPIAIIGMACLFPQAPDLAALRALDPETLTAQAIAAGFGPWGAVDGKVLSDQLVDWMIPETALAGSATR